MKAIELTPAQRRYLKSLAHPLKPLLQIGKIGPSEKFIKELTEQLAAHELIKVRVLGNCLSDSSEIENAVRSAGVTVVQKIGHVYTFFRQREEDSQVSLPKP